MPGGDGTGPEGKGPGVDRVKEGRRRCGDRGKSSAGLQGTCICPECGYEILHKQGVSCIEMKCEKCGVSMVRK